MVQRNQNNSNVFDNLFLIFVECENQVLPLDPNEDFAIWFCAIFYKKRNRANINNFS